MRYCLFLFFAFYVTPSFCQVHNIKYLNESGFKCTKEEAKSIAHIYQKDSTALSGYTVQLSMDGDTQSVIHYSNLKKYIKDGSCRYYSKANQLKSEEHYKANQLSGPLRSWYANGQLARLDTFLLGKSIGGQCFTESGEVVDYFPFRQIAQYPGGNKALGTFLSKNIVYPTKARKRGIEGRVIIQFIVDTDGTILKPQVVRPVHKLLDKEALRVVNLLGKFEPGKQDNIPFKTRFNLPVSFRLTD